MGRPSLRAARPGKPHTTQIPAVMIDPMDIFGMPWPQLLTTCLEGSPRTHQSSQRRIVPTGSLNIGRPRLTTFLLDNALHRQPRCSTMQR